MMGILEISLYGNLLRSWLALIGVVQPLVMVGQHGGVWSVILTSRVGLVPPLHLQFAFLQTQLFRDLRASERAGEAHWRQGIGKSLVHPHHPGTQNR